MNRKEISSRMRNSLLKFRDDEEGAMIAFSLLMLIMLLIIGGMAVDFMRFESRRTLMQGTVDRAVLGCSRS